MKLNTRVFELSNGKYRNLAELAQTMGISQDLIYNVRRGERGIHERFIIGAIKTFPREEKVEAKRSSRLIIRRVKL